MSDDEHIAVTNTVWVNVIEITKERDELRVDARWLRDQITSLDAEVEKQTRLANVAAERMRTAEYREDLLKQDVERLTQATAMLAEEREAWKANALRNEGVHRANLVLQPENERLKAAVVEIGAAHVAAQAEAERLQRENGALARTYALAEEKLRERTEQFNRADDEVATWQQIWNDEALLAARVQAFRNGTADLGRAT